MKKIIALLMVLVVTLGFITGCGSTTTKSSSANVEQMSTQATEPEQKDESKEDVTTDAPQLEPEKVTLKVFMSFPRFKDQFEAYFEQFKAKELAEKNIDVTIELEMPAADQAQQILQARLASNDAPDIFTLHAIADIPTYYEAGYLSDLSDMDFVDGVYDSVKDMVTYDNQVVALPLESLAWGYLYNKDLFNKYDLEVPLTLTDMENVITTLNENSETPFLLSFQESWIPQLMMALSLGGVVNSEQMDWVSDMDAGTASYQDVEKVFDIIDLIMENGTDNPFEVGSAAGSADFANGKAAMWVQGPWMSESILEANPDMQLGVAPLPVSDSSDGAMINLSVSTSLAMATTTEYPEVAKDLLNYILDEQDSSALFEALQFNPLATMHTYESFPWINEAMTYAGAGKAYKDIAISGGVYNETAQLLQTYYTKTVTKEEIIKALDKAWADGINAN